MNIIADILQALGLLSLTSAPRLPANLPVAWLGMDRKSMRLDMNKVPTDPNWWGLLMDNSNLRFTGAYLDGTTLPAGATKDQFTASTRDLTRDWIPNVTTLRNQGWGTAFFYVGYSVAGGEPLPPLAKLPLSGYATRGQLHAQHAKTIVSSISPAMDGAVVYLDNEDGESTNISNLIPYYDAFFDELQKPGPGNLPALRPGLYAHGGIGRQFLTTYPYVLLWEVTLDTGSSTTTPIAPFASNDTPIRVDPTAQRALHPMTISKGSKSVPPIVSWSVGRQFRFYTGTMPIATDPSTKAKTPIATALPALVPYAVVDYDSSVVRDPAYPSADPRLAAGIAPGATAGTQIPVVIEGTFTARAGGNPPLMSADMIQPTGHVNIPLLPAQFIEPEAPLAAATFPGAPQTSFATVLTTGDVATCDSASSTWINAGTAATVTLRRYRSLAFAFFTATDQQVFFAGNDHALWAMRATGGPWGKPLQMGGALQLHPSALIAATSRAATSVDVFSFNQDGLLTTSWWSTTSPGWPDANSQILDPSPGLLLPVSSLAAVSAAANKLHVFAIGKDLQLHYLEFTDTSWGTMRTLGSATQFVFAHSRLAAMVISPTQVQVAAMADNGNVRLHTLDGSSGTWTETPPAIEFNPPPLAPPAGYTAPPPNVPVETAYGWRINPYSDLALSIINGSSTVLAAGLHPGQTALLRRSTAAGSEWERYR